MPRDRDALVYSTDGSHQRCPRCGRHPCVCAAAGPVEPAHTPLRLRLERKGRGGKTVTVIADLPPHPTYGAELLRTLKTHCGTGGTLKADSLEVQGDQRDRVQAYLERLGHPVRRSGG